MRVGSLFAGIGGFDLAAQWVGWETAWYSEIDPYASAVMRKRWPGIPNHGDIRNINGRAVEYVDILCGGFPCQDISLAGKGAGIDGERSGLWSHYARLIEEIKPKWVVIENVSALRSRGLEQVLGALAALGYDAEWHCIPAAYVGAPHRRDRIWIVAWRADTDSRGLEIGWLAQLIRLEGSRWREPHGLGEVRELKHPAPVADPNIAGLEGRNGEGVPECPGEWTAREVQRDQGRCGPVSGWWESEPDVGRVAHGVPSRVDRLRCLGNAIVPQVAALIFSAIAHHEAQCGEVRMAA